MNIVLYARSSHSPEDVKRQLTILWRSLAPDDTIIGTYGDLTPGTGVNRPGLNQALTDLATIQVDVLHVSSLDRLASTSGELASLRRLLEERGICLPEQRPALQEG